MNDFVVFNLYSLQILHHHSTEKFEWKALYYWIFSVIKYLLLLHRLDFSNLFLQSEDYPLLKPFLQTFSTHSVRVDIWFRRGFCDRLPYHLPIFHIPRFFFFFFGWRQWNYQNRLKLVVTAGIFCSAAACLIILVRVCLFSLWRLIEASGTVSVWLSVALTNYCKLRATNFNLSIMLAIESNECGALKDRCVGNIAMTWTWYALSNSSKPSFVMSMPLNIQVPYFRRHFGSNEKWWAKH